MSEELFNWQLGQSKEQADIKNQGRGLLLPRVQSLIDNPGYSQAYQDMASRVAGSQGYSPEEKSAIEQETMGATSSVFGKAREQAERRVAATGNSAGYGGAMDELAREEANAQSANARRNNLAFSEEARKRSLQGLDITRGLEDEKERRAEQGINLLGRLYDIDTGSFNAGRNAANAPLENYSNLANQKGFGALMQNVLASWLSPPS